MTHTCKVEMIYRVWMVIYAAKLFLDYRKKSDCTRFLDGVIENDTRHF